MVDNKLTEDKETLVNAFVKMEDMSSSPAFIKLEEDLKNSVSRMNEVFKNLESTRKAFVEELSSFDKAVREFRILYENNSKDIHTNIFNDHCKSFLDPEHVSEAFEKYSAEWLRQLVSSKNATYLENHKCSICNAPVGYIFSMDFVGYDPNCACSSRNTGLNVSSYADVATWLAMQSSDAIRDEILTRLR